MVEHSNKSGNIVGGTLMPPQMRRINRDEMLDKINALYGVSSGVRMAWNKEQTATGCRKRDYGAGVPLWSPLYHTGIAASMKTADKMLAEMEAARSPYRRRKQQGRVSSDAAPKSPAPERNTAAAVKAPEATYNEEGTSAVPISSPGMPVKLRRAISEAPADEQAIGSSLANDPAVLRLIRGNRRKAAPGVEHKSLGPCSRPELEQSRPQARKLAETCGR